MKRTPIEWVWAEPAAAVSLLVFVLSVATLGVAWFFELVLKIPPCPLCLEERIAYHVLIPLSLLMIIAALVRAPDKLIAVGFVAIMIVALCDVALSSYHAGVEWHWWPGPTDCSGPLTDLKAGGSLIGQIKSITVVRCDQASWRFLGLSLSGYNVLMSLVVTALGGFGLFARERQS